jgi:hypothetical protein
MAVLTSEVGYTSATTGRGDHGVHKGNVEMERKNTVFYITLYGDNTMFYQYKERYRK